MGDPTAAVTRRRVGDRMSLSGAHVRDKEALLRICEQAREELQTFWETEKISADHAEEDRIRALFNYDLLTAQQVYAGAMAEAIDSGVFSRGSYLVTEEGRLRLDDGTHDSLVQEAFLQDGAVRIHWRPVRELPQSEQWFEKVYNGQG